MRGAGNDASWPAGERLVQRAGVRERDQVVVADHDQRRSADRRRSSTVSVGSVETIVMNLATTTSKCAAPSGDRSA